MWPNRRDEENCTALGPPAKSHPRHWPMVNGRKHMTRHHPIV